MPTLLALRKYINLLILLCALNKDGSRKIVDDTILLKLALVNSLPVPTIRYSCFSPRSSDNIDGLKQPRIENPFTINIGHININSVRNFKKKIHDKRPTQNNNELF